LALAFPHPSWFFECVSLIFPIDIIQTTMISIMMVCPLLVIIIIHHYQPTMVISTHYGDINPLMMVDGYK